MSTLAWIDFDEAERQRAQRIMALFQERDSRDELGLGAIRDSISDHLFPGTSTIQTRLRYMLFVPWIFRSLEGRDGSEIELAAQARAMEVQLTEALKAGGETNGVFGRDAGAKLQRLPSSVYWAGLGAWGIRHFEGSIDSYFASLPGLKRRRLLLDKEAKADGQREDGFWHPTLPEMPINLLESTVFKLSPDEAQFIVDRLVVSHGQSLLTVLARSRMKAECDYIWTHPNLADFPAAARRLVGHAEIFSDVMHGAALLYNLALSELRENEEWIEHYQGWMQEWAAELDGSAIEHWSLEDFWDAVAHPSHTIQPLARRFVAEWRDLALSGASELQNSTRARDLVRARERRLKTTQSRYVNRAVLDRWSGASGTMPFSYRWDVVQSHLKDLADAE
ncbi:DUF6361 family protein [Pelagibius sp. 7325]|uniref:DUF6361 family protein n=1 Tax=Pelagibius sp. 7325 TaxID=3131994 RepID=UPI0030EE9F6B